MSQKEPIFKRASGVLVHPTSLPSRYGIGDLGEGAYQFIDFLTASNQKIWQVLPLAPTGFGNSPYQTFSSFAGQPLIISPTLLMNEGLLTAAETADIPVTPTRWIDYDLMIPWKMALLRKAYNRFKRKKPSLEYLSFLKDEANWLDDYALYMALKEDQEDQTWVDWDKKYKSLNNTMRKSCEKKFRDEIEYYYFLQYIFFKQWYAVKQYANDRGIKIIGDLPIFCSIDSADVWANQELFELNKHGAPINVAGVPPDYFSETGQHWGNPLYDWNAHRKTGYAWWIKRIQAQLRMADYLRIDHFRGFESYWSIPAGETTAMSGKWMKGPGSDFFQAITSTMGASLPIIAEDLGLITNAVYELRDEFHLPGMKVLQFAFDNPNDNPLLPHAFESTNCVCYSGTHDNDTTVGWYQSASGDSQDKVRRYLNTNANDISWDFIRACFGTVAHTAIIPIQDILSEGSEARMNRPGIATGNWQYRFTADQLTPELAQKLKDITLLYGR